MIARILSLLSVTVFLSVLNLQSESLIYIPLKFALPDKLVAKKFKHPKKLARQQLRRASHAHPLTGILATYAGYLTISNVDGTIIFPRRQSKTPLYLAITENIYPVLRFLQTVDHLEFIRELPTAFFRIDFIKTPVSAGVTLEIKEEPIPDDLIIPYPTVIIFASPKNMVVPVGTHQTHSGTHWFLPAIECKKIPKGSKNYVHILDLLAIFRPLRDVIKYYPQLKQLRMNE